MEKKYYDLIITLIKQHRKFAGYEAILEDIANDVYEHSKVVLDSVTNEDVITAYLTKVISTSIVTVPKKLNFNTRVRHRVIMPPVPEVSIQQEEARVIPEKEEQTIASMEEPESNTATKEELSFDDLTQDDDNLLDELSKNSPEDVVYEIEERKEEPVLIIEKDNKEIVNNEFSDFDETEPLIADVEEPLLEDVIDESIVVGEDTLTLESDVENSSEQEGSFVEEISVNNTSDVDKNLVDMMINGVPDIEEESIESELTAETEALHEQENEVISTFETIDTIEPQERPLQESSLEETNQEDFVELLSQQDETQPELTGAENSVISTETVELTEPFEEIDMVESVVPIDSVETVEPIAPQENLASIETIEPIEAIENEEPAESIEEIKMLESIEDLPTENSSERIEDGVSLDLEDNSPSFEIEEIAEFNNFESFDSENSFDLEETTPENSVFEAEDTAEPLESISENFTKPCYSSFYFEPQQTDFDEEEILSYLEDINEKHPEKRILEICDLKFKKKLSVTKIIEKTGFTQDEVLSILNEIVDTVKD